MEDILDFVGYSFLLLPLITVISWAIFRGIYKRTPENRASTVVISCVVVTIGSIALGMYGAKRVMVFQTSDVYEMIDGFIAILIGLRFWGKPKEKASRSG
jgi:uncharacterized BrkB/YihY/UPF0761 family membrane protein